MAGVQPTNINLNRAEGWLELSWSDGATTRFPLPQLREACPCVECRGGHQFMGDQFAPDDVLTLTPRPERDHTLSDLKLVGNYALQPVWGDGHQTGIYAWDYLRRIHPVTGKPTSS